MRHEFHANGTETLRALQHTLDLIWLEMRQSGKVSSANEAEIQVEVCRRIVELIAADVHDEDNKTGFAYGFQLAYDR